MSWQADTRALLLARLATVDGIPAAANIALENDTGSEDDEESFVPPVGVAWIRSRLSFGATSPLGGPARRAYLRHDGTWRLLLNFPLLRGTAAPDALAEAICDAFPLGLTLGTTPTKVHIDGARRWGGGPDLEDGYYTVPVDVRWHVHTLNTL